MEGLPWMTQLGSVLNILSLCSASFILATLGVLAIHNFRLVNRLSLRLTAGIALVDIINHANNILHRILPPGNFCVISGLARVAGRQMYCFLNIAIAVNLQLIFLNGLRPNPRWEMLYWGIPMLLLLVTNIPPLMLGMYGYNGSRCFVHSDSKPLQRAVIIVNIISIIFFTFVYCCGITIVVIFRLRSKLRIVQNLTPHRYQRDSEAESVERSLKKLILRISLYPVTCIISMLFYFIVTFMYLIEQYDPTLSVLATLSLNLTGMLSLMAFLHDPTLHMAAKSFLSSFSSIDPSSRIASKFSDSSASMEMSRIPLTYDRFGTESGSAVPRVGGNNNLRLL